MFLDGFFTCCDGRMFLFIIIIFRLQTVMNMMFVDSNHNKSTKGVNAAGQLEKLPGVCRGKWGIINVN